MSDILSSAVFFLHATLEDFLRSLLEWKLLSTQALYLMEVPLAGKKPRSTFPPDDPAIFHEFTVDDLMSCSALTNAHVQSDSNETMKIIRDYLIFRIFSI